MLVTVPIYIHKGEYVSYKQSEGKLLVRDQRLQSSHTTLHESVTSVDFKFHICKMVRLNWEIS